MLSSLYRMIYNILSREGTTATLTQAGATGSYNPATSTYTPATSVTTTVKVALLDYSATQSGLSVNENTLIQAGDKQAYVDGNNLTTKISPAGDTLTIGTTVWRIMNVKEYNVNNSFSILYDLLLRK